MTGNPAEARRGRRGKMRALVQCVSQASVEVEGKTIGEIGKGYLVFLGVGPEDGPEEVEKLWNKIYRLRVFMDDQGKTNWNLEKVGGSCLIVSQFTLYGDFRKGNRPSFTKAAPPALGEKLYLDFVARAKQDLDRVESGEFGADMKVHLVNDGPFTIWLDTAEL